MVEAGGDWDRRNRLQVYEAVYLVMQRDLHQAAKLFLNSVATFTTYELCTFNELILYTVITSVLTLDRVDLRKKVGAVVLPFFAATRESRLVARS